MGPRVFLVFVFSVAAAEKIVFFEPFGTKSHLYSYWPIAIELLNRGHNVSFVTFASSKEFLSAGGHEIVLDQLEWDVFSKKHGGPAESFFESRLNGIFSQKIKQILMMDHAFYLVGKEVYAHEGLMKFVQNEKVDLVVLSIFFADGFLPLIHKWNCPHVLISPSRIFPGILERFGQSEDYSSYPVVFTSLSGKMSFFERVGNFVAGELGSMFMVGKWAGYGEMFARDANISLPDGGISTLQKNASMMLMNIDHTLNHVKAHPPGIIEIGGVHCVPAKPLPSDFEEFVAGSGEHGFIVFGLGSTIKVSDMPLKFQKMFLNAFSRLKQRVIWKWEVSAFDSVPDNVKLVKWLPQQDLLGHPKVRAFLSHGGLLSIQEAVYHGAPLIGLPISSDQDLNVAKVVADGYGLLLDWNNLSEEIIYSTIQEVLSNDSFTERAKYYSRLVKDQPQTPLERAAFWVEYVIRHRGAPHLQSPAKDLTRLQRNLVDVIAFLAAIALAIVMIIILVVKALFRFILRKILVTKPSEVKAKKRN